MQTFMPIMLPCMLFGGFMVEKARIPAYLAWVYWISFIQWSTRAALLIVYDDIAFTDCEDRSPCPCVPDGQALLAKKELDDVTLGATFGILAAYFLALLALASAAFTLAMRRRLTS